MWVIFIVLVGSTVGLPFRLSGYGKLEDIEDITVTSDGQVLMVRPSIYNATGVMECTEIDGKPPELNCRLYRLRCNSIQLVNDSLSQFVQWVFLGRSLPLAQQDGV